MFGHTSLFWRVVSYKEMIIFAFSTHSLIFAGYLLSDAMDKVVKISYIPRSGSPVHWLLIVSSIFLLRPLASTLKIQAICRAHCSIPEHNFDIGFLSLICEELAKITSLSVKFTMTQI